MMDIDPTLTSLALYLLTSSIVAPFVTMLINRPTWSRGVRQGVAAVISIVAAVAVLMLTGGVDSLLQGATSVLMILGVSTVAYEAIWKPTGVAESVETATSPKVVESTAEDVTEAGDHI